DLPITKIRQIAGTDKKGTNALGVLKAAEKLGFEGKGVKAEPDDLYKEKLPLPIIAHVVKDKSLQHYVVIHEIKEKYILIADPAEGIVKYKPEDFFQIWTGVLIIITPSEEFKEGSEKEGLFARFFHILLPHKKLLFEIFLSSILLTIMGLGATFYFKYLIDDILADKLENTLYIISIGIMFLYIFKILMGAFRRHLLLWLGQKVNISLILSYYKHVLKLPLSFFDRRKVGEILSRLSDSQKIISAVSGATLSVMVDSLMVIAAAVVLYLQNTTLFLITLLFIPFHVIVAWSYTKPYNRVHRKEMENSANMRSYLVESLNGAETIKAFNGEREAELETENRFIKFIKTNFKAGIMKNSQTSLEGFLSKIGTTIILMVGGLQILENNMTIGQLITFNALFKYFFGPIKRLINLQPMLQEAKVASDRLGEILDLETEKENEEDKIQLNKLEGNIKIKNLHFRYGTREKVLKNINLKINSG
ncbi:MAG: peptide cleavage/export ABC transporter, partial [Candidatus Mcinerneyibacterium aminivorans]